jgi:hypothetical protein
MYEENLLNIDLNQLVSQQVAEKIEALESSLQEQHEMILKQSAENTRLKNEVENAAVNISFIRGLQESFAAITFTPEVKNESYYVSKQQNQYLFIEKLLEYLYGIKREENGWLSNRDEGKLAPYLAINFRSNRKQVVELLRVLKPDSQKDIAFIESFVMPQDYDKNSILGYINSGKYRTNGTVFGVSNFWAEDGLKGSKAPNDYILENPLFAEDEEVFSEVLGCIERRGKDWQYFFTLPKCNKLLSTEQVAMLGDMLVGMTKNELAHDYVKDFIANNLKFFNDTALDMLYKDIDAENKYRALHWENFPVRYQMKFLLNQPLEMILKLFSAYSCTWTIEQKEEFLKTYFDYKNTPVLCQ